MSLIDEQSSGALERRSGARLSGDSRPKGELADTDGPRRTTEPNGGIAAALLAAGIGCAAFGVLVVLAEASGAVEDGLTVSEGAGPLSGKGLGATVLWAVAWAALHLILRNRELAWRPVARATTALVAVDSSPPSRLSSSSSRTESAPGVGWQRALAAETERSLVRRTCGGSSREPLARWRDP